MRNWWLWLCPFVLCLGLASPIASAQNARPAQGDVRGGDAGSSREESGGVEAVYRVDEINPKLDSLEDRPNLGTPQACLEFFLFAGEEGEYERAAHAMNFRLVRDVTPKRAAQLAERLYFILNREVWLDWSVLPDRPDGMSEGSPLGGRDPLAGMARRNIEIGTLEIDGRGVPIRIARMRSPDREPVWLFAAQTVANVESLYEAYGPSWLERQMPDWARQTGWGGVSVWKWIAAGLALTVAPLIGYVAAACASWLIQRWWPAMMPVSRRLKWPMAAVLTTGLLWMAIDWGLSLPGPVATAATVTITVLFIVSLAWFLIRFVGLVIEVISRRTGPEDADNTGEADRRRLMTQLTIVKHFMSFLVAIAAIGFILIQLDVFKTVGVALLSSAGAAAVVLGFAGHAVLGNLIAGIQIALTQPFTIGDSVYIEDNWGRIESITYTYVVVRTWDKRRLVFPVSYFVRNWFENWSRDDAFLQKPIYLKLDYRADIEEVRQTFLSFVKEDEAWAGDRDDPSVLVTEVEDDHVVVRLLCGAATPSDAWYLHCRVRERMVGWLREQSAEEFLPRRRIGMLESPNGRSSGGSYQSHTATHHAEQVGDAEES